MSLLHRYAELTSDDARLRLAIFSRTDQRFQIVEERVWSYEAEDAEKPTSVPFPEASEWQPWWMIHAQLREGLFGTLDDALDEARTLLANVR
jgi:hypothetical protein